MRPTVTGKNSYSIDIRVSSVPPDMNGTPLPLSIAPVRVQSRGQHVVDSSIEMRNDATVSPRVSSEGQYVVRLELPNGGFIADTVEVAEGAPTPVVHISGENVALALQAAEQTQAQVPVPKPVSLAMLYSVRGIDVSTFHPVPEGLLEDDYVTADKYEYCFVDGFELKHLDDPSVDIYMTPIPMTEAQKQNPNRHPGASGDTHLWRPVGLWTTAGLDHMLMWPPNLLHPPQVQFKKLNGQYVPYASASGAKLEGLSGEPRESVTMETLFSFLRGNALDSARRLLPNFETVASAELKDKLTNPVNATLAAYVLLRLQSNARQPWVHNLAEWFPHLPDGAIIYGWYKLYEGETYQACAWFQTALDRGLPMFSEGLRLLRDGWSCAQGILPDDPDVRKNAVLASCLANAANLDSELTCIQFDGEQVTLQDSTMRM